MSQTTNQVLLLGGLDPSAGAGLLMDHQVIRNLGASVSAIPTCIAWQTHQNCWQIEETCLESMDRLWKEFENQGKFSVIKIGMLANVAQIKWLATKLEDFDGIVIFDPIMATSSQHKLADDSWLSALRDYLLSKVDILTPNHVELERLCAEATNSREQASATISQIYKLRVLAKGGHLNTSGAKVFDYWYSEDFQGYISTTKISHGARGTGCFLASAIAACISQGFDELDAVIFARSYLQLALKNSIKFGSHYVLSPSSTLIDELAHVEKSMSERSFAEVDRNLLRFYPVVDSYDWVERLISWGVKTIQLRIKELPENQLIEQLEKSIILARKHGIQLFINDYWRLAIELGAYGVHLGQEDLDEADLDAISNAGLRLGISTHSYSELAKALAINPSYLALGPIFHTTCKSMRFGPQGVDRLAEWVRLSAPPVVAIGGLKLEHAHFLKKYNIAGMALISDLTQAKDPKQRCLDWLAALQD